MSETRQRPLPEMRLVADCSRGVYAPHHAAETLAAEQWAVSHELLSALARPNADDSPDLYPDAVMELEQLQGPEGEVLLCTENGDWFVCTPAQRAAYDYALHY